MKRTSHKNSKRWLAAALAAGLAGASGPTLAAFFQLAEQNASGLGNAYAGGAAIAEDASTVWYNPAGLTRLTGAQFVASLHFIAPSTKFDSESSTTVLGSPITGGDGGDAGESALVPNIYYSRPVNDRLVFGLGVNAPFGLATDYENDWVGRYYALRSEIAAINVNPSLGYRVNDQLSIGAGVSLQHLEATLTQAVDFGTICTANGLGGVCGPPAGNDGKADVTAEDDAFGYNVGLLFQVSQATRWGVAYRSKLDYELKGDFKITAPGNVPGAFLTAAGLVDSNAKADITLPATFSVSAFHQLSPTLAVMADFTRTYWSDLDELRIKFNTVQDDSVVTLKNKDVNRLSLGATYSPGDAWSYRFGVAKDESPAPSAELRTPRLPDTDRLWLALGANYRMSKNATVDFGFVHLIMDDVGINKQATPTNENASRGNLRGDYSASVNILSVQGTWSF